jgi:hypothetical protein
MFVENRLVIPNVNQIMMLFRVQASWTKMTSLGGKIAALLCHPTKIVNKANDLTNLSLYKHCVIYVYWAGMQSQLQTQIEVSHFLPKITIANAIKCFALLNSSLNKLECFQFSQIYAERFTYAMPTNIKLY